MNRVLLNNIDLDDLRVGSPDGLPVFREHGGNAPLLGHMNDVLRTIYQGLGAMFAAASLGNVQRLIELKKRKQAAA